VTKGVDANVYNSLRPKFGHLIPMKPRPDGRPRTKLVILKSGNLEAVAESVRNSASDTDTISEDAP